MPLQSPFYHQVIRKYIVSFGNLFDKLSIQRFDHDLQPQDTIRVPLAYANKEHFLVRLNQDSSVKEDGTKVQMTLPRMGFVITDMQYDTERKLNTLQKTIQPDQENPDQAQYQYQRVPYNFNFELFIITKHSEDGLQIIEQILPFFTPFMNLPLFDNQDFPDQSTDVPLVFEGISSEEEYQVDGNPWEEKRTLIWTLSFTLKGYLYRPTRTAPLIKQADINQTNPEDCSDLSTTTVTPDPQSAGPTDDFGFNIETNPSDGSD